MEGFRSEALFGNFFRDLAVAGRALSAYPRSHPAVGDGLSRALVAVTALLSATGPLELGAARDALLWDDRRFTSPPAAQLARLLRRRRAAGLLLDPGVTAAELETFLGALAVDARTARAAGSLAAELSAAGLVHVRVSDLDFSALELVEADDDAFAPEVGALTSRVIRRLLVNGSLAADRMAAWLAEGRNVADLLRVILEGGGAGGPSAPGPAGGPTPRTAALEALSAELSALPPAGRAAALAEVQALLPAREASALRQALARVLEGDAAPPAAAEAGPGTRAPRAARAPLEAMRRLLATDDVDALRDEERAPDEVSALLELPDVAPASDPTPGAVRLANELQDGAGGRGAPAALLELACDDATGEDALAAVLGRFESAWRRVLSAGRVLQASALVDAVQRRAGEVSPHAAAFRGLAGRMGEQPVIDALAAGLAEMPEEEYGAVPALLSRLGPQTVRHLLDVLSRTENRRLRFRLLDLLSRLGPAVARDAAALLHDSRWYVVRNMLLLLRRVGDARSATAVRRCVDHPDLRVRLEAIHALFTLDPGVPRDLLRRALNDPDPRQAEAAMELAGKYGIAEAVEPMVECLNAWDPLGKRRGVRLKAIRALAAIADPRALAGLRGFRSRFNPFAPSIEERRELWRTLPAYPEDAYQGWVASGLRSRDPEIRRLSAAMGPAAGARR